MAESSKTLYCSNYPYPSNYNYTLKVSWSESSPSIANNTSVISITGSIGSSNLAWDSYYNSYLKLYWYDNNTGKETLVATSAAFLSCGQGYGGTRSVSKTITVTHKSDGSLSGYAKVVFEAGSTSGGYSPSSNNVATSTLALTTIARASDFSYSVPTAELGQAITMTIDRKSDAFTHKVEYSFAGSSAVTVSSSATTSASFTPAVSLATNIPNSTIGSLTMKVTTFNGSTQIGDPVTKSVDLSVPSSVAPTMGTPTATRVDNGIPSGWGVYVKGYSKVTIAMTSVSGSYGSTIKSYSITGPNLSSTSSSATSNVLVTAGTNTYTCRITDSRGRTAEKTVSINVVDYALPSIKATAVRCSSDGTANKNGTYLKVTVDWNIASVSSKNSVSSRSASCNGVSNTSFSDNTAFVLAANCSIGSSYTLTASVTDALGNSASATVTISTSSRVMNVRKNKTGIAFGKFAELDNYLDVGYSAVVRGDFHADGAFYSSGIYATGNNFSSNGNSAAYMRIATLKVTGGYINCPIEIRYYQRGSITATSLYVYFENSNSTDPSVQSFCYEGWCIGAYIAKTATSTWDIFIKKSEAWDYGGIQYCAHCGILVDITYRDDNYTTLPSGYITAFLIYANSFYPVGAVYITYNNNNPGNFLGGTWEQFGQGRTLIGQGTGNDGSTSMSFSANVEGGEYNHTLTIDEIPSHAHRYTVTYGGGGSSALTQYYNSKANQGNLPTTYVGGSKSHNNLSPYIVVYFWRRTA